MNLRIPLMMAALLWSSLVFGQDAQYSLSVDGLSCPFCAYGIEKRLNGLEGVESVEIRLDAGIVVVTMEPGASLTEIRAREAVAEAGFTLGRFDEIEH